VSDAAPRVRLDKWLWAARFFRTRSRAREAIDGGHVQCNGQRAKPAREVGIGDELRIRQGHDARTLYAETEESVAHRDAEAARRRARREAVRLPEHRPDRRDRRTLERIKKRGGL
jgi:ribosome-associated heat shock protein Hsp15